MSTSKTETTTRARIFVANLPFTASEDELRSLFEKHGAVAGVHLPVDYNTHQPRGFGFIEMLVAAEAEAAIAALNGSRLGGRILAVEWARERASTSDRRERRDRARR